MSNAPQKIADFGPPVLRPAGDMAVLVEFGALYHPVINNAVMAFDAAFSADLATGVIETVPTFRSYLVRFDPLEIGFEAVEAMLLARLEAENWYQAAPPVTRRQWVLPTVYGGARGPDLAAVADRIGWREDQVIDSHACQPLQVAMLGFAPGLAYLGQLPGVWDLARRTEITAKVPAGSVLVAVRQTVLPSTDIPTGWWQIGQTPFRSFNLAARHPFLLAPGDQVRFEPVTENQYDAFDMNAVLRAEAG